ncbi:phage tail protein [uncultured Clostridium sp.]|uniref:phage tail-collar fiber domain-containing protein n=1 Tax=uncultured Clostridium sp. TaxID=59620 RepID=UPI0028EB40CE|nr:phage tail protein [uncultured Clostridium sp.]
MIPPDVGGFFIREYGVFDASGNMLAIAKCAETYKPLPSDGSTKEINMKMVLAISNTSSITLKIDPTIIFAKKKDVDEVSSRVDAITTQLSDLVYQTAGGTATAITLTMQSLVNGYAKTFIAGASNNGAATTINGKPVYKPNTTTPPNFISGKAYTVWYNSSKDCFFIKASAEGNTIAAHVLAGDTFSNDSDTGVLGTMPNNGALNSNLNCGGTFKVPAGYTTGGTITANSLASQTSASADASKIAAGYSAWVNGNLVSGNYDPLTLIDGDNLILYKSTTNLGDGNSIYHVLDSKTVYGHGGTVRIKFSMTCTGSSSGVVGYARIYVNGNTRGIERSVSGTTPITFTEDISINAGDVIQLYAHPSSGGYSMNITNYTISCGNNYAYLS